MSAWVKVEDRLPVIHRNVLVSYVTVFTKGMSGPKETEYRVCSLYWNGREFSTPGNNGFAYTVLAWQDYPEAYRP